MDIHVGDRVESNLLPGITLTVRRLILRRSDQQIVALVEDAEAAYGISRYMPTAELVKR